MANNDLPRDPNHVVAAGGVWNDGSNTIVPLPIDPASGRLQVTALGTAAALIVGTTTVTGAANGYVLYNNNGVLGAEAGGTGTVTSVSVTTANGVSGTVATATTTPAITLTLGAITPTSVNSVVISGSSTPTLAVIGTSSISGSNTGDQTNVSGTAANVTGIVAPANGGTGVANNAAMTVTGSGNYAYTRTLTGATNVTFPTTGTLAISSAAQTFTGTQTFANTVLTANAITATSNAATIPVTSGRNIVTNNSAATLTITLTTASAVNMQTVIVQILDFSAVAQTITWVNTENSTVTAPVLSNGSTTLPLTVGFIYNSATSKFRCIAVA